MTVSVALTKTVELPFGANSNVRADSLLKLALNGIPLTSLITLSEELRTMEYMAFYLSRLETLMLKGTTVLLFQICKLMLVPSVEFSTL